MLTQIAGVAYDVEAACPRWEVFLEEIMAAKQGLISSLQRVAGYAVTGLTEEDVFIIFFGIGNNGKSTFLEILQRMMGDYGQTAETTTFGMTPSPMISQHCEARDLSWHPKPAPNELSTQL